VVAVVAIATDRLTKVFDDGTVAVDGVSLEAASGEFLVLLGPTGCGKSTILRLVAGLEAQTSGHVLIDGEVVDDVPARERRVAMVFQDYALYPHLTAAQNIGFPLRMRHESGTDLAARVALVAEQLGITDLLHRTPGVLSGGERQRVAMARAIVRRPHAFLLDEPLSNLDAGLRAELRGDVAGLARRIGVTTLYVTHDQGEAMTMADRVAVLRRGVLQQVGPPREVYDDPATLFVAAFLGTPRTNLLEGAVYADPARVVVDLGSQVLELPADHPLRSAHTERVTVALRADAMTPVGGEPAGPALRGTVRSVEHLGHEALVRLDTGTLPTSNEQARLELPDADPLAGVVAADPPSADPLRRAMARIRPPRPPERGYSFRPNYDPELPGEPPPLGEVLVRVPPTGVPRRGDTMTMAVDPARMLLFDRAGNRIRR
jgi:multiple sugar transport system ATP-binding protein